MKPPSASDQAASQSSQHNARWMTCLLDCGRRIDSVVWVVRLMLAEEDWKLVVKKTSAVNQMSPTLTIFASIWRMCRRMSLLAFGLIPWRLFLAGARVPECMKRRRSLA